MMHKKDMIFLSILIACSESVVLFYFCSAKSPRSFLCMMISYAIHLIFPLNIFLAFSILIYYTIFCREVTFYNPLLIIYTPLKRPMAPPSVFYFSFF